MSAVKDENGLFMANANFSLFSDFQSGVLQFFLRNGDINSSVYKNDLKTNINLCKINEKYSGNFLAKIFVENVVKFVDFEVKCPFKKVKHKFN